LAAAISIYALPPFWYTRAVRKAEVYVETSVWGAAANVEPASYRVAAQRLLDRTDDFSFFISQTVLREVAVASPAIRETVEGLIERVKPVPLVITDEVLSLAEEYLSRGLFTPGYRNDAVHVALASAYAVDYLASYNFRHIVAVSRRRLIQATNVILGYKSPEIVSPEELAYEPPR
jgi:predicted nucleic acid-binding protein